MVSVHISQQPTVQFSASDDVETAMNHQVLGDCMLVDESPLLCDDAESTPRRMLQGGLGDVNALPTAPSQVGGNAKKIVDEFESPTLADLLKSQESLRKDKARAKAQYRVELPKPKASDIKAIMKLYADGEHPEWSVLAAKFEAARPFQISKATIPMILETGQALSRTPNGKLLASLMKDHGNPVFESPLESRSIAQVSKLPGGNIRVMVTTEDAFHQLECQPVNILGAKYFFRERNTLNTKYHLDIFGWVWRKNVYVFYVFSTNWDTKHVVMST
uniref:AlNc14C87G5575 protein n=1 Tax=Albugo laibachii Nc14 TaxID=890382 RepID=F0WG45_9STRA|nr:AlNc14C87G5575 [Albugo laibachii Nc14]|eukprot:CCA20180.1 AlNc14C87G5575 [Albugo laibachii Nc14]